MKLSKYFAPLALAAALVAAPAAFAADASDGHHGKHHGKHHGVHHGMGHGKDHGKDHADLHKKLVDLCKVVKLEQATVATAMCNDFMTGHAAAVKKHTEDAAHHGVHHGEHHGAHHDGNHGKDAHPGMPKDDNHKKPTDHHHAPAHH